MILYIYIYIINEKNEIKRKRMERDLISEVLGYVDDYGSEVDTILPTFNVQNEREEIFDEVHEMFNFY